MASIQVPIEGEFHVTLIHFDKLSNDDANVVEVLLEELVGLVQSPPSGVYGVRIRVGPRNNVPAIRVQSQWIEDVRGWFVEKLEQYDIPYSKNYNAFIPHVTKPTFKQAPTTIVRFLPWVELHNKSGAVPFVGVEIG